MGRDLAFSPGRQLGGGVRQAREGAQSGADRRAGERKVERVITWRSSSRTGRRSRPDGKTVVFSGNQKGRFDIFTFDLDHRRGAQRDRRRTLRRLADLLARRRSLVYSRWWRASTPSSSGSTRRRPALPADQRRVERQDAVFSTTASASTSPPTAPAPTTSSAIDLAPASSAQIHQRGHRVHHADHSHHRRGRRATRLHRLLARPLRPLRGGPRHAGGEPTSRAAAGADRAARSRPAGLRARHPGDARRGQQDRRTAASSSSSRTAAPTSGSPTTRLSSATAISLHRLPGRPAPQHPLSARSTPSRTSTSSTSTRRKRWQWSVRLFDSRDYYTLRSITPRSTSVRSSVRRRTGRPV